MEHENWNDEKHFVISFGLFMLTPFVIGILMTIFVYPSYREGPSWHGGVFVLLGLAISVSYFYASQFTKRGCSCWVKAGRDGYQVVESEEWWQRVPDEPKVRWEKLRTELRRCEKCGSHYHKDLDEPVEVRETWLEEEDEIRPEDEFVDFEESEIDGGLKSPRIEEYEN